MARTDERNSQPNNVVLSVFQRRWEVHSGAFSKVEIYFKVTELSLISICVKVALVVLDSNFKHCRSVAGVYFL